MYCPVCRDEFRAGFTRCRACDVDLVESLDRPAATAPPSVAPAAAASPESAPAARVPPRRAPHEAAANFCGFLVLEDARQAKAHLSDHDIEAEILIKDGDDGREEFWLRVRPSDFGATQNLLGEDESSLHDSEKVLCAACETLVSAEGDCCPQCGARFEED